MGFYVQVQGFQIFEKYLGVEWVYVGVGGVDEFVDFFDYFFGVDYGVVQVVVLVVQIFGGIVNDQICVQFQGFL